MDPPGTYKTKLDKTWFYFGYVWPLQKLQKVKVYSWAMF